MFKFIPIFTIYLFLFLLSCEIFSWDHFPSSWSTCFKSSLCESLLVNSLFFLSLSPTLPPSTNAFISPLYIVFFLVQNFRLMITFSTSKMLIHFRVASIVAMKSVVNLIIPLYVLIIDAFSLTFFFYINLFIYLFIFSCVGSSFLCEGFL